jgi:hypothetical protein
MAIIYSYPIATPILSDTVIGNQFDFDGNTTKSFSISDIVDLAVNTNVTPKWIKSNESLSLAQRKDDVLYGILDKYTGEEMTLSKVIGTPVVDGIIYFELGLEYFKRNYTDIDPYMFGAKGNGVNNDTLALQNSINFCETSGDKLELKGNFLSNTITFDNGDIDIFTDCQIQAITDVDLIIVDGCRIKHTGSLTLRGTNRLGTSRGIVIRNGSKGTCFDKIYLNNFSLGIDYEALGNNNGIAWNFIECRELSKTYRAGYIKGAQVSNTNIYNIGEITTTEPLNIKTGFIVILDKSYPIVKKPSTTNVYYVGDFYNMPAWNGLPETKLWHCTGGGILHQKHTDNGAIDYKTLNMVGLDGSSLTIQSLYGVTVNGGEIEGNLTNVCVGGIYMDGINPVTMLSIRSAFYGIHTEGNIADQPTVYSGRKSNIVFEGCLMTSGVRVASPETGVKFHSWRGSDRLSNVYSSTQNDFPTIQPINPDFKVFRDVSTVTDPTLLVLADLVNDMEYMGDIRIDHAVTGEFNLLNIPIGVTRVLNVSVGGSEVPNTINGGSSPISISIVGVAGVDIYKIVFVLKGSNYTYYLDEPSSLTYKEVDPKMFGAKGDGVNNDSPAFQAAINYLNSGIGGVLRIDSGTYRLNTGLITYPKVTIQGNGPQNTFLYSYLTGENAMLTMNGASVSTNTLAVWRDFTAVSPISDGIAFLLLNSAYATYENIYSEGFFRHWRLRNCLSSQFTSVRARFGPAGAAGFYADSTGGSNPNALTLTSCVFGSLPGVGIRLDDPSNFNMYGGSVEACGIAGSSAIAIYNGGSQGAAAWNFNGVYFEGNIGNADIKVMIDGALMESAGVIQSCSFNRISATDFTIHNVLLQQVSPTDKYITIDMRGNAFINGIDYIPDVSRKYIAVQSAAKFRITEDSNFYKAEVEIPTVFSSGVIYSPSIDVDASVLPLNGKLNITPTDGNAFTINAPTNARVGQEISFVITNTTGASLGNLTWNAGASGYRLDSNWVQPINLTANTISFIYTNYGLWMEKSRSNVKPNSTYGLYAQTADSTPVTATAVETTIVGPGVGTLTVPANGFQIGYSFQASLDGLITCISSSEVTIRVKTLSGVLLADTGPIDLAAATSKSWILTLYFTIRTLGGAGVASISSGGLFSYVRNGGTQFEGYVLSALNNTTFNTTVDNTLVVTVQWNTASAGNSILSRNFTLTKVY